MCKQAKSLAFFIVFKAFGSRTGPQSRLLCLSCGQVSSLVASAERLIGLLRVKIEDDADLALARTVLEDTNRFFSDLDQCAKWRHVSTWQLFEEVND